MVSQPETQWELSTDAVQAVADLAEQLQHDLKNPLMVVRMSLDDGPMGDEMKQASSDAMARMARLLAELGRLSGGLSREKTTTSKEEVLTLLRESLPALAIDESKPWIGPVAGDGASVVAIIMDWCALLGGGESLVCAVGANGALVLRQRPGAQPVAMAAEPLKLWRFMPGHEGYVPWKTALQARALGLKLRLITREGAFTALELVP